MSSQTIQEDKNPTFWQRLDSRLLPEDNDIGKTRYLWLCYLAMYFVSFFFRPVSNMQIAVTIIGMLAFLMLYFRAFWVDNQRLFFYLAGIWLLGFLLALHGMPGANVFFVYTGAFCAQFKNPKTGFMCVFVTAGATIILCILANIPAYVYGPGALFALLIGSSNIYLSQMGNKNKQIKASQDEIQKIAASAERERIARDLHDLIGHTFSTINVKSQLAVKLVERDPAKARSEIQEIENISRTSLAQVREAVSGYRQRDLATELIRARVLLDSIDIKVEENLIPVEQLHLSQQQNTTLAFIVRELVTNIMRHSNAQTCQLLLKHQDNMITLRISDDGNASDTFSEGSGLQGIRERVDQLNGNVSFSVENGFHTTIQISIT
ncbi:sensor histidine kinase [Marinicella sp. W31]|uniref:sensor histidine kinase n=1 Tax=Marinicella sp. W31 TaxID=3023713 RepID=UPI003758176C